MKTPATRLRRNVMLALLLSLFCYAPAQVWAARLLVTNTNDSGAGITSNNGGANGDGSGIYNWGDLKVWKCVISGNRENGIENEGGTVTIESSTISHNLGVSGGGVWSRGTLNIFNSTINDNRAPHGSGGGVVSFGTFVISNSTISGNRSYYDGGIFNHGTMRMRNSTVYHNEAVESGGVANEGSAIIDNSIIAGNSASLRYADGAGDFTSHGYNLIGRSNGSTGFSDGFNNDRVGLTTAQLKLGPLQNNGGPTLTHALLLGSHAIDAGSGAAEPAIDQRGYNRNGASDSGAFEFDGAPPVALRVDALIKQSSEASTA